MATTTAPQQAAPASPGPMKRIILIAVIALIAAGAAGAGVWFFMAKRAPVAASAASAASAAAAPAPPAVPLFFPLESMTVNLQSDDGQQHFLRIGLTLKLGDAATQQVLTDHMPEVRSRILLALSNHHPDELAPLEGKRALAEELKKLISEPTDKGAAPIRVQDVLFTEFVVQ